MQARVEMLNLWISPASWKTKHTEHLQILTFPFFQKLYRDVLSEHSSTVMTESAKS